MDGTVAVESVKGEGSAFTITLPLLPSPSDDLLEEGGATEESEPHGAEQSPLDPATLVFSHPLAHEADDAGEQGDSAEPRESGQAASETATPFE